MRTLVVIVLCAAMLRAEPEPIDTSAVKDLTFRDAIELALAYNLGLKSARFSALIERLSVREQEAAWDPTFTGSVGGGEDLSPSRSQLAGADVVDTDSFNFAFGVQKPTRVGPSIGVNWRADRIFSNSSFNTLNPAYDTAIDITLTVPLLQGRGRRVQESQLRATRAGAEGARAALLADASQLIRTVAERYWALVFAQGNVRVLQKSVEVARDLEDAERKKFRPEVGRSTKLDVTKAEAETKRREVSLIQGQLDLANASDDLRQIILPFSGVESDEVTLRATDPARATATLPNLNELVRRALATRPELKQTDFNLKQLEESIVQAQDSLRLKLDFSAALIFRGVDGSFDGSAGDTLSGDTPSANAGFALTVPFGRRAARAALQRAELQLEKARIDRREQVNGIIVEVRRAHRRVVTAQRGIEATDEEVRAARDSLTGERQRLARGSTTLLEVARLEENLTAAELRLVQAKTALEQARIDTLRASGQLLEAYGIRLGEDLELLREAR